MVIDIVHQLLNLLLIPHLKDETNPSSPASNPHLILQKSDSLQVTPTNSSQSDTLLLNSTNSYRTPLKILSHLC